jgi:hypothetical protein
VIVYTIKSTRSSCSKPGGSSCKFIIVEFDVFICLLLLAGGGKGRESALPSRLAFWVFHASLLALLAIASSVDCGIFIDILGGMENKVVSRSFHWE